MRLDKHLFIRKVLSRFPLYTQNDDEGSFYDTYSRVLTNKVDYEKLWDLFCNEYAGKTPPSGVEIKNLAKRCYLEKAVILSSDWAHVSIYSPIYSTVIHKDCFPWGTSEDTIIKTYEKKFGCTGWKIIEIR